MSKVSVASQAFCDIDVSTATLSAAVQRENLAGFERREFERSSAASSPTRPRATRS